MDVIDRVESLFERKTSEATPLSLKIAVVLQGLFFASLAGFGRMAGVAMVLQLLYFGAKITVLKALWSMRRWSLYALQILLVLYVAPHAGLFVTAWKGVLAGTLLHSIALLAAFAHRRRLT